MSLKDLPLDVIGFDNAFALLAVGLCAFLSYLVVEEMLLKEEVLDE